MAPDQQLATASSSASSSGAASSRSASPTSSRSSGSRRPRNAQAVPSSPSRQQREGSWTASDSSDEDVRDTGEGSGGKDEPRSLQPTPTRRRQDSWTASSSSASSSPRASSSSDDDKGMNGKTRAGKPSSNRSRNSRPSPPMDSDDDEDDDAYGPPPPSLPIHQHLLPSTLVQAATTPASSQRGRPSTGIALARTYFEAAMRASLQSKMQREAKDRDRVLRRARLVQDKAKGRKRGRKRGADEDDDEELDQDGKKKKGKRKGAAGGGDEMLRELEEDEDGVEAKALLDALSARATAQTWVENEAQAWLGLIEDEERSLGRASQPRPSAAATKIKPPKSMRRRERAARG